MITQISVGWLGRGTRLCCIVHWESGRVLSCHFIILLASCVPYCAIVMHTYRKVAHEHVPDRPIRGRPHARRNAGHYTGRNRTKHRLIILILVLFQPMQVHRLIYLLISLDAHPRLYQERTISTRPNHSPIARTNSSPPSPAPPTLHQPLLSSAPCSSCCGSLATSARS